MTEAERFGGKYIYFCPMGLTCFVSPILGEGGAEAKLTVGPFITVSYTHLPCIMGLVMHTSFERTGHFECSDDTLMTIQRLCHWSSISNCQGVPTDCPHREKNAWTGDAGTVHDQLLLNYDAFLFLEKWLDDLCQSQRPNGSIPCVCPSTGWGYNWGNGPDLSLIHI